MYRYNYYNSTFNKGKVIKIFMVVGIFILFAYIFIYYFLDIDKFSYERYKKYETDANKKLEAINSNIDKHLKEYNNNTISKAMMIKYYEDGSLQCTRLYDSFKWSRGDEGTKEIYVIKKHIIIIYAYVYESKASALRDKIEFQESVEVDFITKLQDRYTLKDRIERVKFNIPFIVQ